MYIGSWAIDDNMTFYVNTHVADSGTEWDADSVPTYRIYEDETGTPLLTGSMALLDSTNTEGFYSEQVALTAANGFEQGKTYAVRKTAVVSGIQGSEVDYFQIEAEVNISAISGDNTAANNLEADYDGTGYNKSNSTIGTTTTNTDMITTAQVNAEVDTALADIGLDHLISAAVVGADVTDNSIIARLVSASATADWDDFVNTTDSLQAIRDKLTDIETDTAEIGSAGAGLTGIPWNASWDAEVESEVNDALVALHLDHLLAVDYDPASKPGTSTALLNELIESDGGVSRFTANALEQGPSGGGTNPVLLQNTTIATLASQTSFTLTAGSADDDAYNGCVIVVTDQSTSTQKAVGVISDYTGSTRTITLLNDPGIFTMAVGDTVDVIADKSLKPTVDNRTLDVTATGAGGIDWGNVENAGTTVDLSATDINLVDTATTITNQVTADVTAISGDTTAANNLESDYDGTGYAKTASTIGTATSVTNVVTANVTQIGGDSQSGTDLKDMVDTAYDPTTNQIQIGPPELILSATINTVNSQTEYVLSSGSSTDDAYNGQLVVLRDASNTNFGSIRIVTDYVGSTNTLTVNAAPNFTVVASDIVRIHIADDRIADILTDTDTTIPGLISGLNDISTAQVNAEVDTALADIGLDHLVSASVTGTDVTDDSIIARLVSSSATADWDDFVNTTDSLQAIRDRGDSAWITGGGGSNPVLLQNTTIATLASQTSFTLTAGSADDDAYNGCVIVVTDQSTSTQKAVGVISDYTGSTRTVTLLNDPAIFTMAVGDTVDVVADRSIKPTTDNRTLDVTATGAAGIDWGNIENPTTTVDLSGTDINLVDTATTVTNQVTANVTAVSGDSTAADNLEADYDGTGYAKTNSTVGTVTTLTGHTAQTGDSYARLGAPAGASVSADIATVDSNVDAILVDTGTTLDTKLDDIQGAGFSSATDSLEAIRDRGDAAWTTGSGSGLTALATGTAQSGSATTIQLASGSTFADDEMNGNVVKITSGTGVGQSRVITDYVGATDTATVSPSWTTNPDNTSVYEVVHGSANLATVSLTAQTAGNLVDLITTVDTVVDAIETDTQDIQSRLPSALVGGRMDSNMSAINNVAAAAVRLAISANKMTPFTVDSTQTTPSTTVFEVNDITSSQADLWNNKVVLWTSGALENSVTAITDYSLNGSYGRFTVNEMVVAPSNGDTGLII